MVINQSDILERNDQVGKMGTIYACAATVVIWLGQNSDIDPHWAETEVTGNMSVEDVVGWMNFDNAQERDMSQMDSILNALTALSELPYWHRAWVLQEVAFARRAIVMFGQRAVPYEYFISFWQQEHPDYVDMFGSMGPLFLIKPGSAREDTLSFSVWEWINRMQRMGCTDLRDKLYACLALFSADIRDRIEVDYAKSVETIFFGSDTGFGRE